MGFNRLYVLLATHGTKKQQRLIRQQSEKDGDEEECDDSDERKTNMNKADILHQSAERIEQLERQLAELTSAHSRRHSLQSSMFTHSTACIVVIHIPSGCIADVSERYLQHTAVERSWVLGRRFFPTWHTLQSNPMCMTQPVPATTDQSDRVLCRPDGKQLQPTVQKTQSEATIRLMHQLHNGEIDTMCAAWYCYYTYDKRVRDAECRPNTHPFNLCVLF